MLKEMQTNIFDSIYVKYGFAVLTFLEQENFGKENNKEETNNNKIYKLYLIYVLIEGNNLESVPPNFFFFFQFLLLSLSVYSI